MLSYRYESFSEINISRTRILRELNLEFFFLVCKYKTRGPTRGRGLRSLISVRKSEVRRLSFDDFNDRYIFILDIKILRLGKISFAIAFHKLKDLLNISTYHMNTGDGDNMLPCQVLAVNVSASETNNEIH